MAETDSTNENLQKIVRAVVANLNSLPVQRNLNVGPSSNGLQQAQATSTDDELRQGFKIPRGGTSAGENQQLSLLSSSLADNFNVLRNYSSGGKGKSNKKGKQPARSSNTGRFLASTSTDKKRVKQ